MKPQVLVLDCGAHSVRAILVDSQGNLLQAESRPNAPKRQFRDRDWLIWDTESIWKNLLLCARAVLGRSGRRSVAAVIATSFSDDGAPVDERGGLLYPVISWQCPRTVEIAESIDEIIPFATLYRITGEQIMRQHTLFRLLWLRRNAPGVLEKAHAYLMFPGILNYRLTGEMVNDPTTADSMMLLDIRRRDYSPQLLSATGFVRDFFGRMVEPGQVIGTLRPAIARGLGLEGRIPVVAAGHDTQFAVCGSGCESGEAVLSSGTWEILFLRSDSCLTGAAARRAGIKNECDAVRGLFNTGQQWLGSGALEWCIDLFRRRGGERRDLYSQMIAAAERVPAGSHGVMVEPSLLPGSGISRRHGTAGTILGCTLQTTDAEIYRAFLEGLSFQLRTALEQLKRLAGFSPARLTVAGGGSRNHLWNRIRADVLGLPLRTTRQTENTVVGAAIFGLIGAGVYGDYKEALAEIDFGSRTVEPSGERGVYDDLYERFGRLGPSLEWFYAPRDS